MDMHQIDQIVRRGAVYLSEALYEYWPAKGENEIAERNISLHIARSFAEHGFHAYAEVHNARKKDERQAADKKGERLDLLLLEPLHGISVVCEFKRLYSGEKLDEMVADLDRISRFKESEKCLSNPIQHRYGLIAATTWQDSYLQWWTCDAPDVPDDDYKEAWKRMDEATQKYWESGIWGCHVLEDYSYLDEPTPDSRWHYLLYLLFRR